MNVKIRIKTNWEQIKRLAIRHKKLIHSMTSCYWIIGEPQYYTRPNTPCGPHAEPLISTECPAEFLARAEQNAKAYGRHGIRALEAAYHGNIVNADTGSPTSLKSWEDYNRLLDAN